MVSISYHTFNLSLFFSLLQTKFKLFLTVYTIVLVLYDLAPSCHTIRSFRVFLPIYISQELRSSAARVVRAFGSRSTLLLNDASQASGPGFKTFCSARKVFSNWVDYSTGNCVLRRVGDAGSSGTRGISWRLTLASCLICGYFVVPLNFK